jgi:hypothetical protein
VPNHADNGRNAAIEFAAAGESIALYGWLSASGPVGSSSFTRERSQA